MLLSSFLVLLYIQPRDFSRREHAATCNMNCTYHNRVTNLFQHPAVPYIHVDLAEVGGEGNARRLSFLNSPIPILVHSRNSEVALLHTNKTDSPASPAFPVANYTVTSAYVIALTSDSKRGVTLSLFFHYHARERFLL